MDEHGLAPWDSPEARKLARSIVKQINAGGAYLWIAVEEEMLRKGQGKLIWHRAHEAGVATGLTQREGPVAGAVGRAEAWLEQLLEDGPVQVADMERLREEAGHAKMTVERARKRLGVRARRLPGTPTRWGLFLPPAADPN